MYCNTANSVYQQLNQRRKNEFPLSFSAIKLSLARYYEDRKQYLIQREDRFCIIVKKKI